MRKISGIVLDQYDDSDGAVLRTIYPTADSVPEIVKQGHRLSFTERTTMPEDTFALVLVDEGSTFRKYSMADKGNTALSIEYFLKTGHKLPLEAQKVAASNLLDACNYFELTPPEALEKIAIGAMGLLSGALVVPGAVQEAKANLKAVKGTGGTIMTPDQMKARKMQMGVG
jgi:hypothetical protein